MTTRMMVIITNLKKMMTKAKIITQTMAQTIHNQKHNQIQEMLIKRCSLVLDSRWARKLNLRRKQWL